MQSKAKTVEQYLSELPADRRRVLDAVRAVILKNLDKDYEEGMSSGMIGYYVPHRVFPPGYHCDPRQPLPFAGLASQKNYMSVYLMSCYGSGAEEKWLRKQFADAGKKLDMGKCCIRFKRLEDLPVDVIGEAIRRVPARAYVAHYQSILGGSRERSGAPKRASPKKKSRTKKAAAAPTRRSKAARRGK